MDDRTTVTKPSARYVSLSELPVGSARTAYAPVRVGAGGAGNAVGAVAVAARYCLWMHPAVMAHSRPLGLGQPHGMTLGHSAGVNDLFYAQPAGSITKHRCAKKSGTETAVRCSVAVQPSADP